MNKEDEDTNQPLISQITENYEENGKSVMESVLEEVALRSDEDMPKETTKVFPELSDVEDLHLKCNVRNSWSHLSH